MVLEALSDYAAACFRQYGLRTDVSGHCAAMYRPYHLIGAAGDVVRLRDVALAQEELALELRRETCALLAD